VAWAIPEFFSQTEPDINDKFKDVLKQTRKLANKLDVVNS